MRVKNLVLGIGIVIVYGLMLWQGIEAFYPSPQYDDFCLGRGEYYYPKPIDDRNCSIFPSPQQQQQCSADGGVMTPSEYDDKGCAVSYYCDFCNKEFNDAREGYSKRVFFISLIAGIITLIIGYAILSVEPVGSALMASGVWAIFYGTAWNWANLSSIWRFLLLLVALVLLIWIALRINKKRKKWWMFWR